ncbi:MAG: fasciclin domain-containing protein [Rhodothermales bacterium]
MASVSVTATDLSDGMTVTNMADGDLTIGVGAPVTVTGAQNTATVVIPDVDVSNGGVHVIDAVLLPPSDDSGSDG